MTMTCIPSQRFTKKLERMPAFTCSGTWTPTVVVVKFVRRMTPKTFCKHDECGSFKNLHVFCGWIYSWCQFCTGSSGLLCLHLFNTFRNANESFSFHHDSSAPANEKLVLDQYFFFFCSFCGSNCPQLIIRGFPFKGNNSWTHLHCYNVFGARKPCQIDNLLPLKFRSQTVSPIQTLLRKNLVTICRVILAKTSQKMTVNLLMMVSINLPIIKFTCQHHASGYVCLVWHLLKLIEMISIAKVLIIVHFLS